MKVAWRMMFGLVAIFALVIAIQAADKEETLKGTVTCAKCDLKIEKKSCATVIVVAKDKKDKDIKDKDSKDKDSKETVYYFDKESHSKYHKPVCMEPKKGTVTGVVSEKDGKHMVKVSKIEYEEKDKK